jgi:hypothetical protein
MQCLVEISRVYYGKIGSHIDQLIKYTCHHVSVFIYLDVSG